MPAQPTVRWAPGQKGKVKGRSWSREGDEMLVRQESSNDVSAVTPHRRHQDRVAVRPVQHRSASDRTVSLLAPGLFVKIHGSGRADGNLVATRISFHKRAVKVQNSISAGEVELREKQAETPVRDDQANLDSDHAATARARDSIAAITSRIANLDKYVVK